MLEKYFVPYNKVFKLKELGFDEDCLATVDQIDYLHIKGAKKLPRGSMIYDTIDCPLFCQVFDWFREKYNLDGSLSVDIWNTKKTSWRITGGIVDKIFVNSKDELYDLESDEFDTYEEAQLTCLDKLIEICS